jgi:predicted Zn-dependent protease
LAGSTQVDFERASRLIDELRAIRECVPEDPYLAYSADGECSEHNASNELPSDEMVLDRVVRTAGGHDLVGTYASGSMYRGFAGSLGQRNWHASRSYNFDWSLFDRGDKAVKAAYAGFDWNDAELSRRMDEAGDQLAVVAKPSRTVKPGGYRVYLAPGAMYEIMVMMGWGGFGIRAHRTKTTPLIGMVEAGRHLAPEIDIAEATENGVAPDFEAHGFRRPARVPLIEAGRYGECLVSAPSSVEYGVPTNGAGAGESPDSLEMAAGRIERDRLLAELDTGIYISNLWYLNFSDRNACRTTGMTRFATFWVEAGQIREPLEVMRFDDTLYRVLGDNLIGLTRERDMILDPGTYGGRSTSSARLPGALIDDFRLTL